jgi:hypothetical protein
VVQQKNYNNKELSNFKAFSKEGFGGAKIEKIGEENGIILPLQSRYIPPMFVFLVDCYPEP